MVTCNVCGGVEFENYDGFIYCAVCQTQSQEYHHQEYEYQEADTVRRQKKPKRQSKKKVNDCDDGVWTSWEAFNYILYGMTQELKNSFSLSSEFQSLVLKLWASYLKACKAGFISHFHEALPKLQFDFKHRDARVLYNIDVDLSRTRSRRSKSVSTAISSVSNTSVSSDSKRSLAKKKSKIIAKDYQEHFSTSALSSSSLNDETLESLGKSSLTDNNSQDSSDCDKNFQKFFREIFSKKNYKLYKSVLKLDRSKVNAKDLAKKNIKSMAKNKLLSIIHLALLMTNSEIQLSDLLRFIREGHLSYAKVTHFLPKDFKFSKNDFCYIDVISDPSMPTHLRQRKISSQLACLLHVKRIQTPNIALLLERYCHDLNLPEKINKLSKIIASNWIPEVIIPKSKALFPGFEAWAMVTIIFVMKLLFGLNDRTEIFLSDLAKKANSNKKKIGKNQTLFVFEDWQKFLECRKTVLINLHYPTQEQLNGDALISSKMFLNALFKESKDEYRSERFTPYSKYYMDENFMESVRQMVSELTRPQKFNFLEFQPSLTPQSSYLEAIINQSSEESEEIDGAEVQQRVVLPTEILNQSFKQSLIDFVYDPENYLKLLENDDSSWDLGSYGESDSMNILLNCSSTYWILHDRKSTASNHLSNFKEEIFEKTPENFQWFTSECARMLEMNVRDVYDELISLEMALIRENVLNRASG